MYQVQVPRGCQGPAGWPLCGAAGGCPVPVTAGSGWLQLPRHRARLGPAATTVILRRLLNTVSERLTPRLAGLRCFLTRIARELHEIIFSSLYTFWIAGEIAKFLFQDEFGHMDSKIHVSVILISSSVLGKQCRLDLIKNR